MFSMRILMLDGNEAEHSVKNIKKKYPTLEQNKILLKLDQNIKNKRRYGALILLYAYFLFQRSIELKIIDLASVSSPQSLTTVDPGFFRS